MKRSALICVIRGKFLLLPLFLLAAATASRASVTITGHVKVGDTTAPATNVSKIRMQLMYCVQQGQNTPRVIGTGALISPQFDIVPASDGSFSFTSYGNDAITCDTAGNSRWRVIMIYKNGQTSYNEYNIPDGGTFNLDTASTSSSGATAYTPTAVITNPAGDQTIAQPGSTNLNINRLNITGTCTGCGGTPPVTSVFGRIGAVVQAANDYNFNQLAGASTKAQSPATDVYTDQANTYTAGMKQTFGASATTAGEGFGGVVADPSGAVAGDRWYRTDLNCMRIFTAAAHCVMFTDGSIAIGQTPLTTRGDLMTVNSGGALARLAIGGANTLLHGGTDPAYSAVAIGDVTGSTGTGLFVFATSPTVTDATVNQAANGDNLLFGKRFTDSSPTGNLIYFKNAANNADLFQLDASGVVNLSNNLLWATDNSFDIGGSAANRPRNINFASQLFGAGSQAAPAISSQGGSSSGIWFTTTHTHIGSSNSDIMAVLNSGGLWVGLASGAALYWSSTTAADGAGDLVLVRDGAGILAQKNGNNDQKHRVYGSNADYSEYGVASELITLSTSGATTDSAANLLPANAIIGPVDCRITTTITTATNWSVGDATIAARFSPANSTLTAGTTSVGITHVDQTGTSGPKQTAAAKLRITTTGTPGAGAIRCSVHYTAGSAPTS